MFDRLHFRQFAFVTKSVRQRAWQLQALPGSQPFIRSPVTGDRYARHLRRQGKARVKHHLRHHCPGRCGGLWRCPARRGRRVASGCRRRACAADHQPGRAHRRQPELAQGQSARPDPARRFHPA
ncbi:hypothetical protein CBM2634_B60115 [Cupriavidus taiwanensis]|uniref:Uncharacterized protein n=1 Tax=Cupriavidus taiwanensis TaxID=164546 RepID=A0A375J9Z0_9BURK|nr:hypothetical protein CBM2634_B60115 [Cupriavidus taiwanensis]